MDRQIFLRFAGNEDCWDIFKWRNDPVAVKVSPSGAVKEEEHLKWFNEKINSLDTHIFIISNKEGDKIGMVRFDRNHSENDDGNGNKKENGVEVSININPLFRGKGYGKTGLREAVKIYFRNFSPSKITARIHLENKISEHVFSSLGFEHIDNKQDSGGMLWFVLLKEKFILSKENFLKD